MAVCKLVAAGALLFALQLPAAAAPRQHCLSRNEQRAAIASGHAVTLAKARRVLHHRGIKGALVRARLCRGRGHLVYLLTVLPHDGKVRRVTVNAANGRITRVH